ncbi:hypothetical protein Tco_0931594, partial [Tanacetum coccineum]
YDDDSPNMGNHVKPTVSANIDNVHNMDNIDSENIGSGYNMNDNIIHNEGTSSGHNNVKVDSDGESRKHEIKHVGTYANAAKKVKDHIQNKLNFVPTIVKDLGNEVKLWIMLMDVGSLSLDIVVWKWEAIDGSKVESRYWDGKE